MSHFTVLVIGDDPDKQLAPYQENNMEDCPREFLEFHDKEKEFSEEFENGGKQNWYPKDYRSVPFLDFCSLNIGEEIKLKINKHFETIEVGTKVCISLDKEINTKEIGDSVNSDSNELLPEEIFAEIVHLGDNSVTAFNCFVGEATIKKCNPPAFVTFKEHYETFEKFCKDWHGHSERDPEKGVYGYWENPNAKWDWYQLGGRWTGIFMIKKDDNEMTEIDSLSGLSFSELKKLGRWKETSPKLYNEVIDKYSGKRASIEESIGNKLWETGKFREHSIGKPGLFSREVKPGFADSALKRDIDFDGMRAKSEVDSRALYKKLVERHKNGEKLNQYFDGASNEDIENMSEDQFIDGQDLEFGTFAVIKDGKWFEKGQMGWWACVSNEDDEWDGKFKELFDSLDDDVLLSVYDCHI